MTARASMRTSRAAEQAGATARADSNAMLHQLADALPNMAWEAAADGAVLWFNQWFYEYTGVADGAGLGWNWAQIFHDQDLPGVVAPWRQSLATGEDHRSEARFRRHDGAMRWFVLSTRPQKDDSGRVLRWFGTATDIDDARPAEARSTAALHMLEAVTESTELMISAVDPQFRLTMLNAAYRRTFEKIYGIRPEVGMSLPEAVASGPGDWQQAEPLLRRALNGESFGAVNKYGDPQLERNFLELYYFPVRDAAGEVIGAARIFSNVTERERARSRERFLVQLDDAMRALSDAAEIQAAAARMLGEHLHADRCAYAEVDADEDSVTITGHYLRDMPSVTGRYTVASFGSPAVPGLRRGEVMLVEDCETDPRLTEADRRTYRAIQLAAIACVPLHRGGRFVAMMALHSRTPRRWREDEVELLNAVAHRCWESMQRAKAEATVRTQDERFRVLIEGASQIVWTADPDGRVVQDCPSWRAFTGQSFEQLRGMGWLDAVHPEDRERFGEFWLQTVKRGRALEAEYRLRHVDGGWRWAAVHAHALRNADGSVREWAGMVTDINERKHAERRDAFLVQLDDSTRPLGDPDDIALTAVHLLCEHLNADRASYLEVDEDQNTCRLIRDHAPQLGSLSGSYLLDDYGAAFARAMRAGLPYVLNDLADGGLTKLEHDSYAAVQIGAMIKLPLHKSGRLVATVGVYQGRARQWQPEEIALARAVVNRCWESIERARVSRELREADRRKDEFLATLAHELRNPLAPLRNALHVVRHSCSSVPPERMHEMMERQVNQLVRLVDDLLDVSRITRGKIDLQLEPLLLAEVLSIAVETARPLIESGRHRFELRLPQESLAVRGDAVRLTQIFANLLNNAAKYTKDGGSIVLSAVKEGERCVVSVRDSGVGIAPEMRERVFDIFAQVSREASGGLGIGLSLVRSLVKLHGGSVEVRSEGLGKGSEFIVRLPLDSTGEQSDIAAAPLNGTNLDAARRILVVDDNRDAADTIAMLLKVLGADVQVVYRAEDALAALDSYRPTLAFLDIGMPDMDGHELARRIRAHAQGRNMRLVALTGWGHESDRRRSREAGFDQHLIKPVDLDSLEAVLDQRDAN